MGRFWDCLCPRNAPTLAPTSSKAKTMIEASAGLRVGDKRVVTIEDAAFGGDGVARCEDFVIFVPFVIPGEQVEVEITEVKKRFARARLVAVRQPSPDRVSPACRYFGVCGGCQYQHVAYGRQLELKRKQIADLMERLGHFPRTVVEPVVACPQGYAYRNRIMVRTQWNKLTQSRVLGFIGHDDRFVVDIEECLLAEPVLNEELTKVRANPPPKGGLKVVLRQTPSDWEVPPDSFFQNNIPALPRLVAAVRACLREARTRHLADVYCGVGFFAIELGDLVESFAGVEIDLPAVQAARRNAARQGRTNGEFLVGDAHALLPELLDRFAAEQTTVILDPPRRGCLPATLALLRQIRPAQIIHVSCHPATLARDLSILCASGVFELRRIVPVDMFPQTQHVECVADLRRGADTPPGGETPPAGPPPAPVGRAVQAA